MKTFFLFIDGLGIGELTDSNPFTFCKDSLLYQIIYESDPIYKCFPSDARLGVEGLPQSGTGHVAILTGKNASQILGKHHGPFPHTTQREWLKTDSIASWCDENKMRWDVLNAYPPQYFTALEQRKIRMSAFAFMQTMNGHGMHTATDLANNLGFPSLLTFSRLEFFGVPIPNKSPKEAVQLLIDLFKDLDLGIIEYFALDYLGHDQKMDSVITRIYEISEFLSELKTYQEELAIVICADHGNVEDCSSKSHTLNQVPIIVNQKINFLPSSITEIKQILTQFLLRSNEKSP